MSVRICLFLSLISPSVLSQTNYPWPDLTFGNISINFNSPNNIRNWDGFGVNYVETTQTRNYTNWSQDYGGFSILTENDKQTIINLTFGVDGLRPGLVKMWVSPFHEGWTIDDNDNNDPFKINMSGFDHETTTKNMLYCIKSGYNLTKSWGGSWSVLAGLHGPAPWQTWQKFLKGRDLDPTLKYEFGEYIVSWAKWLREYQGLPVDYISLHNEGECYDRWPANGTTPGPIEDDYNIWFPPQQVADFMQWMPMMLEKQNATYLGIGTGETSNWFRFQHYGYSNILSNSSFITNVGLITSHGFTSCSEGNHRSFGIDEMRASYKSNGGGGTKGDELHAWTTSDRWNNMDSEWCLYIMHSILSAKINGYIPWAFIQRPSEWIGGGAGFGNGNSSFIVYDNGTWAIQKGYYYYKQFSRAGQRNMLIVNDLGSSIADVYILGFAKGNNNIKDVEDSFIITSVNKQTKTVRIKITATNIKQFDMFR
eukprot:457682_1